MNLTKTIIDQNTIRRRGTGLRAYNPEKLFLDIRSRFPKWSLFKGGVV
jgi:hypothetical protein